MCLKYLKKFESTSYGKWKTHCKNVHDEVKDLSYILEDESVSVYVSDSYMSIWSIDIDWGNETSHDMIRKPFFQEYLNRVKEILGNKFTIKGQHLAHGTTRSRYIIYPPPHSNW